MGEIYKQLSSQKEFRNTRHDLSYFTQVATCLCLLVCWRAFRHDALQHNKSRLHAGNSRDFALGVWLAVKGNARCPVIAANGACRIMIKAKGTHCSPSDPLCSECARPPQSTVCLSAMSPLDISAAAAPLRYSKKQEGACCADSFFFVVFLAAPPRPGREQPVLFGPAPGVQEPPARVVWLLS